MTMFLLLTCFSLVQELAHGFPSFRSHVPNGGRVPCPSGASGCKEGICQGLGHATCYGGSLPLNKFGQALKKNDFKWTQQLCEDDSDGDGFTNGEELGDPCCLWAAWGTPSDYTAGFSPTHPGDRSDKPQSYLRPVCETTVPKARAPILGKFNPGEVQKTAEVRIDNYTIPFPGTVSPRTTYVNIGWNFPDDSEDEFHVVLAEAIVGTGAVLHHFVVTGCPEKWPAEMHGRVVTDRNMMSACQIEFGGWAPGGNIVEMPAWAGMPIGAKAKLRAFMVNVHFDNAALKQGIVSQDGMRIHYTPTLRPETLTRMATLQVSRNPTMFIPPRKQRYFMTRECTADIKNKSTGEDVEAHVLGVSFHAHLLGAEMVVERVRENQTLAMSLDTPWHFDDQYLNNIYVQNITLKTGDKIQSTCIFNSLEREKFTVVGVETTDEMCWNSFQLPGDLKVSCTGQIWTGELSLHESLLGLQSRHPVTTADAVWTGESLLSGGSLVSSKLNLPLDFQCADAAQMQPRCPRLMAGLASGGSTACDKTLRQLAPQLANNIVTQPYSDQRLLSLCCTDACKSLCPDHTACHTATTTSTAVMSTAVMSTSVAPMRGGTGAGASSSRSTHSIHDGLAKYVLLVTLAAGAM